MTVLTKADADALLSLRDAIANWDELVGWGLKGWAPNSNPCAGWTGVSCSNAKRVIGVDLSGWMIKGTLPAELALLDELRTFNASDCDLTGGLPIGWAANGAFRSLSVLDLSNNARLAAEIPGEWGDARAFPALTVLALRNVGLAAPLNDAWPASRAAMAKLATLDLSGNAIRGALPVAFGSGGTLTKLRNLLLNNNSIAGTLPKEWGNDNNTLPSLSVLDLSRNVLEGRLPKSWGSDGGFSQLTELHLQVNRLAGSLPTEWGQSGRFPRLGWLDVYGNRLAGPVPDSWGRRGGGVSRLSTLSLRPGNAKLCGKVPLQLRNAAVGEKAAPLGPAPLALRTLDQVEEHLAGARGKKAPVVLPVLSMVDRRKALHREVVDSHPDWLAIPHASVVEQMGTHQAPLADFAGKSVAAKAVAAVLARVEAAVG